MLHKLIWTKRFTDFVAADTTKDAKNRNSNIFLTVAALIEVFISYNTLHLPSYGSGHRNA